MTETEAYAEIRSLLGGVTEGNVSERILRPHLSDALEWLAQELGTAVEEDSTSIQAETGRQEYPLLPHVNQIKWVQHNGVMLDPTTTDQWSNDGFNYKQESAGYPDEYAVEGRKLIFSCPFSADAVSSAPTITFKFTRSSRGQRPASMPDIPDSDARLACKHAAWRWCIANPQDPVNVARAQGLQTLLGMDLEAAKFRNHQPIEAQQPTQRVFTGRAAAAR